MVSVSVIGSVLVLMFAVGLIAQTLIVNAEKIMSALAEARFSGDVSVYVEGESRRKAPVILRHAQTSQSTQAKPWQPHAVAA